MPIVLKIAFHVSARAVPLSKIRRINFCPSVGVPVGAAMVIGTANAVTVYWSVVSESIVNVDVDVVVLMRGVMRLLVSVSAPVGVT